MHLDCAGPWATHFYDAKEKKTIEIKTLTLTAVDKSSNFPEIWRLDNKEANTIARSFDAGWSCKSPRPIEVRTDNGTEFNSFEFQEMMHSYGIRALPTTVKNQATNAIVERLHLWMADVLRMKTFEGVNLKFEV